MAERWSAPAALVACLALVLTACTGERPAGRSTLTPSRRPTASVAEASPTPSPAEKLGRLRQPFAAIPRGERGGVRCIGSSARADLDGDSREDLAFAYPAPPKRPPDCSFPRPRVPFRLLLLLASGEVIRKTFSCESVTCGVRTADLDGDDRSELAVDGIAGAQGSDWVVYRLGTGGLRMLRTAPPGDPALGLLPGRARFGSWVGQLGSSEVTCVAGPGRSRRIVAADARRRELDAPWRVHAATLVLRGTAFTVIRTRDYVVEPEGRPSNTPFRHGLERCAPTSD